MEDQNNYEVQAIIETPPEPPKPKKAKTVKRKTTTPGITEANKIAKG